MANFLRSKFADTFRVASSANYTVYADYFQVIVRLLSGYSRQIGHFRDRKMTRFDIFLGKYSFLLFGKTKCHNRNIYTHRFLSYKVFGKKDLVLLAKD